MTGSVNTGAQPHMLDPASEGDVPFESIKKGKKQEVCVFKIKTHKG